MTITTDSAPASCTSSSYVRSNCYFCVQKRPDNPSWVVYVRALEAAALSQLIHLARE